MWFPRSFRTPVAPERCPVPRPDASSGVAYPGVEALRSATVGRRRLANCPARPLPHPPPPGTVHVSMVGFPARVARLSPSGRTTTREPGVVATARLRRRGDPHRAHGHSRSERSAALAVKLQFRERQGTGRASACRSSSQSSPRVSAPLRSRRAEQTAPRTLQRFPVPPRRRGRAPVPRPPGRASPLPGQRPAPADACGHSPADPPTPGEGVIPGANRIEATPAAAVRLETSICLTPSSAVTASRGRTGVTRPAEHVRMQANDFAAAKVADEPHLPRESLLRRETRERRRRLLLFFPPAFWRWFADAEPPPRGR